MPFVTTLTLTSGDRHRLDDVVADIKDRAERKGVQLKGPRQDEPEKLHVPQSKSLGPDGGRFDPWEYTVFTRSLDIVGYDEFARSVAGEGLPPGMHLEVSVERKTPPGSGS
ncbi:uS10/mL48 family ribosomal protein [Haloarcula marina]|uniref:uS10/mL48 family ribosomal protein n=1 Tax=Haloarcula marina TaxID=2961574 RepID=UPI0020B75203|nr:uS10/mL48 family ribosomal protein [Halomicroarcula marina]